MRDPLGWAVPLGRLFGISIRVHWLFPIVCLGLLLRSAFQKGAVPGQWIDLLWVEIFLFISVLLHEFGHCFGARIMDGEASDILMWPLGGLATVEVPHTAKANFVTTIGGPLVNVVLAMVSALVLLFLIDPGFVPPLSLFYMPARETEREFFLNTISGEAVNVMDNWAARLLGLFFWVNWFLALFNLLIIGFPLDGGRILQSLLWPHLGYRQATLTAVFIGFIFALIIGIFAIFSNEVLAICLALFIYMSCKYQWIMLETGGEDSMLGYDFSQGYTSLERDLPATQSKKKLGWWQRWQQRRAAKKLQREQEQREAEEKRMDELLQKVQERGLSSLTEEEKRFMKRVSDRYRNKN